MASPNRGFSQEERRWLRWLARGRPLALLARLLRVRVMGPTVARAAGRWLVERPLAKIDFTAEGEPAPFSPASARWRKGRRENGA